MARTLHHWLQRLLPRFRREQYGRETTALFVELLAETLSRRGRWAGLRLWGREIAGVIRIAITSRWPATGRGSGRSLGVSISGAWRLLRHQPGFAVATALIVALGVGATATVFAVADRVWLSPLPFPQPDQLVDLWEVRHDGMSPRGTLSGREAVEWPTRLTTLAALAPFRYAPVTLTGVDGVAATRLAGIETTEAFARVLGRSLVIGRWWNVDEDRPGSNVVVVSETMWRSRLNADPDVMSRTVQIDGQPRRIIGVWPADAGYPTAIEVWLPSRQDLARLPPGQHLLWAVGRLRASATLDQAQQELTRVAGDLASDFPDTNVGHFAEMARLSDVLVAPVRPMLVALVITAACLLLIATSNLSGLLLSRALMRQREFAVRRALGARPLTLVWQLVVEGLFLAVPGAALGVLLAAWAIRSIVQPFAFMLPRGAEVSLDIRVVLVAFLAAVIAAVGAQWLPIWRVTRAHHFALGGRDAGAGRDPRGARRLIVGAQMAIALALVCAAVLLSRSLSTLSAVDRGFEPTHVATFQLQLAPQRFSVAEAQLDFVTRALTVLRAIPDVRAAGVVSDLPFSGSRSTTSFEAEGVAAAQGRLLSSDYRVASSGYFSAMEISLLAGREFTDADSKTGQPVAIVNHALASQLWPGQQVLGKRIHIGHPEEVAVFGSGVWRDVVGVIADIVHDDLRGTREPELYIPYAQSPLRRLHFVVRTDGNSPLDVMPSVRSAMTAVDPNEAIYAVRTMADRVGRAMAPSKVVATSTSAFALVAVLLAAVGIYATLMYIVGQRAREFGVRLALGARAGHIVALIGVEMAWLVGGGLIVGGVAAYALAQLLSSILTGVTPGGVTTFAAGLVVLITAAVLATVVPIHRALRLDPARLLQG